MSLYSNTHLKRVRANWYYRKYDIDPLHESRSYVVDTYEVVTEYGFWKGEVQHCFNMLYSEVVINLRVISGLSGGRGVVLILWKIVIVIFKYLILKWC